MKAQPSVRLRVMDGAMRILCVGDLTYGARPQRGSGPPATPHARFIWKEVEIIEEPLPLTTHYEICPSLSVSHLVLVWS